MLTGESVEMGMAPEFFSWEASVELKPVIMTQSQLPMILVVWTASILIIVSTFVMIKLLFWRKKKHLRVGEDVSLNISRLLGKGYKREAVNASYPQCEHPIRLTDTNDPEDCYEMISGTYGIDVGYDDDCQIRIDSKFISGHQCRIFLSGKHYYVSNLSQCNVTKLNGVEVSGNMLLSSGSVLTLGDRNYRVKY